MIDQMLSEQLRRFTMLRGFRFEVTPEKGDCTLVLDLAENEFIQAKTICIEFEDVANLSIKDFGGGATQLLCLSIKDIRDQQLDRMNFQVTEYERDMLSFTCSKWKMIPKDTAKTGDSID